jgi:hypothetical protein
LSPLISEAYKADDVKQVASLVKQSQKGSKSDVIVKVTERRPDDISVEQETPVITVTGKSAIYDRSYH